MTTKGNKYLAYVRVSSHEQAERNISIPSQIEQIENYAKNNWYSIIEIFREESSAFKWKRKIFNELLDNLNSRKDIKWIIVFKFDRLSRNLDDFVKIDKIIREKNLELLSVTEPMLNSYLWRYLIRDMQNRAILYSEELSFRVKLWIRKKLQIWWSAWWFTPYWYDNIKWKLIPNDKARIVKEVFTIYSYWQYWFKELTKIIKIQFWIDYLPKLERIISNHIYIWRTVKNWEIWNEEYIFWWYDKPWLYKEEYELNYVIPIVSEDLFNICQKIKMERSMRINTRTITYPKIFKCICWRNLSRDDKKWNIYLRCPKNINSVHNLKCEQKYINLKNIKEELLNINEKLLLGEELREKSIKYLNEDLEDKIKNKNDIIKDNELKLWNLKSKQLELTNSFIDNVISKEIFEISSRKINNDIEKINNLINWLKDIDKYINAIKKTITFLNILWEYDCKAKNKNGSRHPYAFFNMVANLTLDTKKVLSYELKAPFNLLLFHKINEWWVRRDSNPRPSP